MESCNTPATIYNLISTLLDSSLGIYTYPNGYTEPAISIGNLDDSITVSGIECVINPVPTTTNLWGAYRSSIKYKWSFDLIAHGEDTTSLFKASEILLKYIPTLKVFYVPSRADLVQVPKACFEFTTYESLRSLR